MAKLLTENLNRVWSSLIINELIQNKVTHFYLSPGMRNAPLIAALAFYKIKNKEIKIFTCIDERGASYRALGYSKATGRPCALLCTSGTALANYYPAVIESYKSNIPLIIVSADRPKEQVLSGDNQTINQNGLYGNFIRSELDLGVPTLEISPRNLTTSIANLISKATSFEQGPVHMNCPFREPLENTILPIPEAYLNLAIKAIEENKPATTYLGLQPTLANKDLEIIVAKLQNTKAGILVIGSLASHLDVAPIRQIISKLNWPVYLDVSSSLKYEYSLENNSIPTFDHPEVLNELTKNPPETIFHIGGRLTSKHYYSFLQSQTNTELITLNSSVDKEDPAHTVSIRAVANLAATLNSLSHLLEMNNTPSFNFKNFVAQKRKIIEDGPLSYPMISKMLVETLENDSILYIANSTIVRSFDSYCALSGSKKFTIATNRGVSGIEGFIASASGFVDGKEKDVFLITGDVSFMHDLNSLFFLKKLTPALKIILINNFGGGIFTLLPINKEEDVLSYITSPHNEKFENIAHNFGLNYLQVTEVNKLQSAITELQNSKGHTILEIFVDNELNKLVYNQLRTIKLS
jgi:2-succinyl-5-enolpyruvyl-6-hydroxy-3-cyclohexene-1-carboxylate synthase